MWRKWFKWIRYLKTKYRQIILIEMVANDGCTYLRFAERIYGRQVYAKLKRDNQIESMRLYNDGRAGSSYICSWKEVK